MPDTHVATGRGVFTPPEFHKEARAGAAVSFLVHAVAFFLLLRLGGKQEESAVQRVVFDPPRPILQKSFELAKRPEISEVQMEMLQSIASQPELSQELFALGKGAGGGTDLLGGGPATSLGTMNRAGLEQLAGAKAAGPAYEQVKMV